VPNFMNKNIKIHLVDFSQQADARIYCTQTWKYIWQGKLPEGVVLPEGAYCNQDDDRVSLWYHTFDTSLITCEECLTKLAQDKRWLKRQKS